MKRRWRDVNRISFMMQIIASVLILLLVSSVLIRVYQASINKSKEADIITRSTRIARISAEYFSNRGSIDDVISGWDDAKKNITNYQDSIAEKDLLVYFDKKGAYQDSRFIKSGSDIKKYIDNKNKLYVMKISIIADDGIGRNIEPVGIHAVREADFSIYFEGKKQYLLPCKTLYMTGEKANE